MFLSQKLKDKIYPAKLISDELSIPKEFVSKILQELTLSGLVISKKGKGGGFALAVDSTKIKLADIISALNTQLSFNKFAMGLMKNCTGNCCPMGNALRKSNYELEAMLKNISVCELSSLQRIDWK